MVDGTGKYVMPGIIDAHSHLNTVSTNEARNPVTAEVTMEESINPNSVSIYRALAGGVTSIHLMHGEDQSLYFSPLAASVQSQAKPLELGSNWFQACGSIGPHGESQREEIFGLAPRPA